MTTTPRVWTFFYGSYIDFDVLKEVDLIPQEWEVARLAGFDIRIEPRANLIRSDAGAVYGILATATADELTRLYTAHAQGVLGRTCPKPSWPKRSTASSGLPCATSARICTPSHRSTPTCTASSPPPSRIGFPAGM